MYDDFTQLLFLVRRQIARLVLAVDEHQVDAAPMVLPRTAALHGSTEHLETEKPFADIIRADVKVALAAKEQPAERT